MEKNTDQKNNKENSIICTVNGYPITIDEVYDTYQIFLDDIFRDDPEIILTEEEKNDLLNESIYTLIDDRLIYLDAKENNIEVTENEINFEEEEFRKQFNEDLPLEIILEERGYDIELFRQKLLEELTIKKMLKKVIPDNIFTDQYLWEYYQNHKDILDDKEKKLEEKSFEKITIELRNVFEEMIFMDLYTKYVDELFEKAEVIFNEKNCEILFQKK